MSSWFLLELDTTPPNIEIIAPQYTKPDMITEFTIVASEILYPYQEIYLIDCKGIRHDLTFLYQGDKYSGKVQLQEVNIGIVTLYARLRDDVFNESELASYSFNLLDKNTINMVLNESESIQIEISVTPLTPSLSDNDLVKLELNETEERGI